MPRLGADTLQRRAAQSGQIFERRQAAREDVADEFETVTNPENVPIRRRENGGFGPSERFLDRQRPREAAAQLDPRFPAQDLGPGDVRETGRGFEPREPVRRRRAAREFEQETPLDEVDPREDVVAREGGRGFGLAEPVERRAAARSLNPTD